LQDIHANLSRRQLFNNYADQAGYYDLCLLIYHAADYNNPRVVEDTWESLINNIHFEIQGRREAYNAHRIQQAVPDANGPAPPPQPYEAISAQVQTIAHRTSLDSLIFPIDALLPVVCRYAISDHQDAGIGADPAWPIILFLQLGVSHALVTRVLEQMHDAQEAPFTGRRRRVLVQWINVAVDSWVRDVERRGGGGGGGKGGDAAIGPWVVQLLQRAEGTVAQMLQTVRGAAEREELEITRRKTAALARDVESLVAAATATARLGFGL
jgi:nuclear pore complex protein Nup155